MSSDISTENGEQNSPQPTAHGSGGCSRRDYLRRVGTGAATVGAIGAGGSQVAPQFSPVGRAQAHPALAIAAAGGILVGSRYLMGHYDDSEDETDTYETLERLALWADAFRNHHAHRATEATAMTTVGDFAGFSTQNLYDEGMVKALETAHDGGDQQESIDAGSGRAGEIVANMQRNIIDDFHLHTRQAATLFEDIKAIEGQDPYEWTTDRNGLPIADYLGEVAVEYELLDGSTHERDAQVFETAGGDAIPMVLNIHSDMSHELAANSAWAFLAEEPEWEFEGWMDTYEVGDEIDLDSNIGGTETVSDPLSNQPAILLEEWPEDEYDDLPPEEQDAINPPDDPIDPPELLVPGMFIQAMYEVHQTHESSVSDVEQFISENWDAIESEETDPSDFLTGSQLTILASDQDTFPYQGGQLAALGLPRSDQTVKLRFPETTYSDWDEFDEEEHDANPDDPVESWGNLYADEMPGSGFQKGSEYDPANLTPTIYFSFHDVDEEGQQTSDLTILEEPFEVLEAKEIDEDGNAVDVDEVTYSGGPETTESPADYDDVINAFEEWADLEREIADQQHEIVVELEGDSGGGGGGFWPEIDGGAGGAIVGGLVVLGAIVGIGQVTS